ncbi:MAG: hypothetical protein FWD17_19290 [Polyangiaceae bacterium]|nr:hypothetical protein [Polyangiaceae bacterium]
MYYYATYYDPPPYVFAFGAAMPSPHPGSAKQPAHPPPHDPSWWQSIEHDLDTWLPSEAQVKAHWPTVALIGGVLVLLLLVL